jgi:hypothetical protein
MLEAQLSKQKKIYAQGRLSPYFVAATEASLGQRSAALKYLELCIQSHDEYVLNLASDPRFSALRGDAEYGQLLAKIGLPAVH